ncbi:hypothetical protein LR69_03463 [Geobacillus sp. BCO2]|nr:hypothetical protein LR69_03463 [Geobacillus sp. BCO2]
MATQRPQRSDGNREKGTKNPGKRVPGFFRMSKKSKLLRTRTICILTPASSK